MINMTVDNHTDSVNDIDEKIHGRETAPMLKKGEKILLAGTIIVGAVDLLLANGVYLKKKGIVLRDMVLTSIDQKINGFPADDSEAMEVPIE